MKLNFRQRFVALLEVRNSSRDLTKVQVSHVHSLDLIK